MYGAFNGNDSATEEGIPFKEFYKGIFEEVYLFFHPFLKPETMLCSDKNKKLC